MRSLPYCSPLGRSNMAVTQAKFWGWGTADRQPPLDVAEAAREHLGFEPAEPEEPARVDELELPSPRVEPPPSLAEICSSDPYDRASHAYGKAYRDIVRAFRGRIGNPPDVIARPREEREVAELLEGCTGAGVAAIPYG